MGETSKNLKIKTFFFIKQKTGNILQKCWKQIPTKKRHIEYNRGSYHRNGSMGYVEPQSNLPCSPSNHSYGLGCSKIILQHPIK